MANTHSYSEISKHPSFSSTLLDQIYRSIDQGGAGRDSMRKIKSDHANVGTVFKSEQEQLADYQRACMIDKWMYKKVTEKIVLHPKAMSHSQEVTMSRKDRQGSSSSSSHSSGSSFFSSSETEYFPVAHRPKPVRTEREQGKNHRSSEIDRRESPGFGDQLQPKPKHESGFLKTKSRALKIYRDLKKAKQPISPGGKVAAFLNSLFAAGNSKKPKVAAACSPASSLSRSCLSKASSKSSAGKRSVRFSPVNVTVDEDFQPNNQNDVDFDEEIMMRIMEKNRQVEATARDFLMKYHKNDQNGCEIELPFDYLSKIDVKNRRGLMDDEEDDEFDAESYASSDLFELDNLSEIGMERYREELPVYETTNLDKIQTMQML